MIPSGVGGFPTDLRAIGLYFRLKSAKAVALSTNAYASTQSLDPL